jgi:alpha-L-rhamnosidase
MGKRLALFYDAPGGSSTSHMKRNVGLAWLDRPLSVPKVDVSATENIKVADLRCEYLENPLGIDIAKPRLSWQLESGTRSQKQTAYRIIVASSPEKLKKNVGDLWDTGKVKSDRSIHIAYNGRGLVSKMRCFWKVQISDVNGKQSSWSTPATWSMGLSEESDWKAQWIGYDAVPVNIAKMPVRNFKRDPKYKPKFKTYLPAQYLRKDFNASKKISRACLYVTAQGHVEMHLNGKRVGNEYFTPGWTDYRKRIYYRTYDVTDMLSKGSNAIGAILGDGWFRGNISVKGQNQYGKKLRLLTQLQIDYKDGSTEIIASGPSWKASFGPIILSDMFEGETYDARKEIPGWDKAGYNDKDWSAVNTGSEIEPLIQAYPSVPVRVTQELPTVKLTEPKPDTYVFDLGQNFSGWARLKVKGKPGDKVNMQFAEMLNADGTVYADNLRSARAADNYILKGGGEEIFEPHFTFHGFRYVQLTGLTEKPTPKTITGIVIHSDMPMTSSFECSNPMLNQLYSNTLWGQRSNYLEIPTDCPQRDERLGWTGDTQVFVRTGTYNQDAAAFFTKWNIDLMDTQNAAGTFGQQAPVFHGYGSPAWADAGVICPWTIYKVYGDVRMIEKHYDAMAKFIDYCRSKGLTGPGGGYGDWLAIGSKTPKEIISAAYFGYTTSLMVEIAQALGKTEDVKKYRKLFDDICANFQKEFVQPDGKITDESQTSYCLALHYNLLTDKQRTQAATHLVDRIKAKDYHLSVGFVGVSILLPTLTEIGRSDLAYRLIQNTTYPSWGYSIEQGATTIWERWNSYTKKDGFGNAGMNSFNHYAYGACGEWMFASMLGIETDGAGFKKIIMKPELGEGITWAKGHYDSIHGRISSDWKRDQKTFQWKITVPANTTATVYVPAGRIKDITESGKAIAKAVGVKFIKMENNTAVLKVDSGSYEFISKHYQCD